MMDEHTEACLRAMLDKKQMQVLHIGGGWQDEGTDTVLTLLGNEHYRANVRIKLGDINARIAPLSITADGLASLGFSWVATDKASKLYRESDFGAICKALIEHIESATSLAA